jgi:predicted anti-sigma-YlaC factor YlaD
MKTNHLLESEIQQYSLDRLNCDKHIIDHIQSCETCREKAEAYAVIFSDIKDQLEPAFDFDLTDLVMKQLPQAKPNVIVDKTMIFVLSFIALIAVGFTVVFFWSYFSELMTKITPMLIYFVSTCVVSLMIFMGIDLFSEYHKKLKILNYY